MGVQLSAFLDRRFNFLILHRQFVRLMNLNIRFLHLRFLHLRFNSLRFINLQALFRLQLMIFRIPLILRTSQLSFSTILALLALVCLALILAQFNHGKVPRRRSCINFGEVLS
jgi:hypothetical protein